MVPSPGWGSGLTFTIVTRSSLTKEFTSSTVQGFLFCDILISLIESRRNPKLLVKSVSRTGLRSNLSWRGTIHWIVRQNSSGCAINCPIDAYYVSWGIFAKFKFQNTQREGIYRQLTSEAHSERIADSSGARNGAVEFTWASSTNPSSIILDAREVLVVNFCLGHGWLDLGDKTQSRLSRHNPSSNTFQKARLIRLALILAGINKPYKPGLLLS